MVGQRGILQCAEELAAWSVSHGSRRANPSIYWKLEVKSSQLTVVGLHRYQSERCGKTEADQLLQRNSREGGLTLTTPYAVPTSNADANNGHTLAHGTSRTAMTIRIDIAVQEHYLPEKDNSLNIDNDNNNTRLSGKKKSGKIQRELWPAILQQQ